MAETETTAQDTTDNAATGDDQAAAGSLLTGDKSATGESEQAATDQQQDDAKADDDQTSEEDDKAEGAPEKYELKLPDGMEMDADALAEFEPLARELNLDNATAQKLVDIETKRMERFAANQQAAWQKQLDTWVTDVKSDKEIGGKAFDQNVDHAKAAITKFGTPELKTALDATGFGNHPELVRVFARIGKAMAEDTFVQANAAAGKKSAAELFYGSQS